jgi:hypothetical protein
MMFNNLLFFRWFRCSRRGQPRNLGEFHFSIHTAISYAPSGRFVRPLGGRGTSLAKRRLDDHAPIGGAGAPPSQRPDYFRIDPENGISSGWSRFRHIKHAVSGRNRLSLH